MTSHGILKCIFQAWKSHGIYEKWQRSWKSHGILLFGPNISRCLKTRNILLVMGQKYARKRLGFQHFLIMHGKLKLVMEKSLKSH